MIKFSKADQEILEILKEVFQLKRVNPLISDDNLRLWLIRMSFGISVIVIGFRVFFFFSKIQIDAASSEMMNIPVAFFLHYFFYISILNLKTQV